jgi:hypothetical protein
MRKGRLLCALAPQVDGVDALPRLPALDELVAKLAPPHEHLSQCVAAVREGRPAATAHGAHRRCATAAQGCGGRNEFKRRCQAAEPETTQEVAPAFEMYFLLFTCRLPLLFHCLV